MGYIVPPLRAVTEGMKGARIRSADRSRSSPSVLRPSFFTNNSAIRRPRPVTS